MTNMPPSRRHAAWLLAFGLLLPLSVTAKNPGNTGGKPSAVGSASSTQAIILAEHLAGLRFLSKAGQIRPSGFSKSGLDVTRTPLLQKPDFRKIIDPFLGKPVSLDMLHELETTVRKYLQASGHAFTRVYVPPQDITGGHVQVMVIEAVADSTVEVAGAKHFPPEAYRAAIRQKPGQPIDQTRFDEDIAWLNRNPYRHVQAMAAAGPSADTTRLGLRVTDENPWNLTLGADNTGTQTTGQYRQSASMQWGNAFGRGDLFDFGYSQDPGMNHFKSYNSSYVMALPWRDVLTFSGAWSQINPIMPQPFSQTGTSWQYGARYEIPLGQGSNRGQNSLAFTYDYKYTNNNLLFTSTPVTNNAADIIQFGAVYSALTSLAGGSAAWDATIYVSPGNLSQHNKDASFDLLRAGAKAEYTYEKFSAHYVHPLIANLRYSLAATVQLTNARLLGSEQLSGGGSSAVRGYRELSAFGDSGEIALNEIHLPPTRVAGGSFDTFGFFDVGHLHNNDGTPNIDLKSLGVGVNYQWRKDVAIRAAFGHQLEQLSLFPHDRNRGHVAMNFSW